MTRPRTKKQAEALIKIVKKALAETDEEKLVRFEAERKIFLTRYRRWTYKIKKLKNKLWMRNFRKEKANGTNDC